MVLVPLGGHTGNAEPAVWCERRPRAGAYRGDVTWTGRYPERRLVPYDHGWATRYTEHAAHLTSHLGPGWELEHVGSTSVPGLVAKPVIDIAISMPAGATLREASRCLLAAGWSEPERVGDHWASTFPAAGVRAAIAHLFTATQWPEAHVRLFASWLRRHPHTREQYASLKEGLVERGVWGSEYTESKGAFVLRTVNRARADRGLGPVSHPL